MEFYLRILKFIQFVKANKCIEATDYAKQHFKKYVLDDQKADIQDEQKTLIF